MPKHKMAKRSKLRRAVPRMKRKSGRYATKRMGSKPRMNPYH